MPSFRVSAVIPVFNRPAHAREAVESALAQTLPPAELVVVDDGSTDETPSVLREFGAAIRVIRQPNSGAAAARNRGVREATGDWIAFLDSDDVWLPHKLERQTAAAAARPDIPVFHTDSAVMDPAGRPLRASANRARQSADGRVFEAFFMADISVILTSTVLMRRDAFLEAGGFDSRFPIFQDYDFFLRLAWRHPIGYVPEPLTRYRLTPVSLTRSNVAAGVSEQEAVLARCVDAHPEFFAAHPDLAARRWARFHREAGMKLFYAGLQAAARRRFARAIRNDPSLWPHLLAACLPVPVLAACRRLRERRRARSAPRGGDHAPATRS